MATASANLTLDESAMARVYQWLLSLARDDDQAQPADDQPAEGEAPRANAEEVDAAASQFGIVP